MNFSSRSDQSPNFLDFRVDFSKYKAFSFLEKSNKNQPDPLTLKIEDYDLLIEDFTRLKDDLQKNLESYINIYHQKIDKLNQEKKQVNNQKLKKQTINPPINPSNTVILKEKPQPRSQLETTPIIKNPQPKIEKHSSNQTSNQTRHHDKKNVSKSTGVERPSRQSTEKVNKTTVWYKSEQFFQKLPSNEELNKVFSIIDTYVENRKNASLENLSNEKVPHWSERMNQYVRSKKMSTVPPPPPDANEISDYWKKNQISFQMEDMQKRSFSVFHHLINSFVELDAPLSRVSFQNSPLSSPNQTDEIATKESNTCEQREPNIIASFSLLPQFASDSYMALSFDQRLSLEIESLDLNPPNGSNFKRTSPIEEEINTKIKENDEIVSTLSKMRTSIMDNIDNYRMQQQKRSDMIDETGRLLSKISNKQ